MKKYNNEENRPMASKYNMIVSRLSVKAALWRTFSVFLLLIVALMAGIICYIGSRPRQGYVVEVSASSGQVYLNPNGLYSAEDYEPNDLIKRRILSTFIENLRSVSTDRNVNSKRLLSVYSMMDQSAADQIKNFVLETDPVNRGATERVMVDVYNISKLSSDSWQIDWRETVTGVQTGALISDKRYRAILGTTIYKPRNEDQREKNPLGFYVTDISISAIKEI